MDMSFLRVTVGVLLGMLLVNNLAASQTYWLSDKAPTKELAKKMRPSHGGLVIRGKGGMYTKKLWLRKGQDPIESEYVQQSDYPLLLVDPDAKQTEIAFSNKGYAEVTFDMPTEGFYNLFQMDKEIDNEVLKISVVKNESLNHSCRAGHDHVKPKMPPLYYDGTPIDIIRERLPKETFHTRMTSGDIISYKILVHGKPVSDASVTIVTQKGWAKTKPIKPTAQPASATNRSRAGQGLSVEFAPPPAISKAPFLPTGAHVQFTVPKEGWTAHE